jgi:hypothetical protein
MPTTIWPLKKYQLQTAGTGRCITVLFMNELKNLTNVVLGKLGKLVNKQNCYHDLFFIINYNSIIVQVRCITIETKEVARIGYNGFLLPHSYLGEGHGATQKKKAVKSNTDRLLVLQ